MSQHWFDVESKEGMVEVMLGWDPPLQWFHMCIDFSIDSSEDPLYTNLAEPDPYSVTPEYLQSVLERFEITDIQIIPGTTGLYEKLIQDRELNR
ncbi:hypothetical protein U0129_19345 [Enterobacter hormaechei]|uniref:hypothetical protein n=1 Tax=Enterobacter hormaechei TaxID=158836 RepID=UPI0039C0BB1D